MVISYYLPYHMRRDQADKTDTTDKCHRNSCNQRPCDHTSNDQRIYRNAKAFCSMMSTFKGIVVPSVPIKPEPRCQRQNTDQTDFSPSGSSSSVYVNCGVIMQVIFAPVREAMEVSDGHTIS